MGQPGKRGPEAAPEAKKDATQIMGEFMPPAPGTPPRFEVTRTEVTATPNAVARAPRGFFKYGPEQAPQVFGSLKTQMEAMLKNRWAPMQEIRQKVPVLVGDIIHTREYILRTGSERGQYAFFATGETLSRPSIKDYVDGNLIGSSEITGQAADQIGKKLQEVGWDGEGDPKRAVHTAEELLNSKIISEYSAQIRSGRWVFLIEDPAQRNKVRIFVGDKAPGVT